jgi:hypothetical protein
MYGETSTAATRHKQRYCEIELDEKETLKLPSIIFAENLWLFIQVTCIFVESIWFSLQFVS